MSGPYVEKLAPAEKPPTETMGVNAAASMRDSTPMRAPRFQINPGGLCTSSVTPRKRPPHRAHRVRAGCQADKAPECCSGCPGAGRRLVRELPHEHHAQCHQDPETIERMIPLADRAPAGCAARAGRGADRLIRPRSLSIETGRMWVGQRVPRPGLFGGKRCVFPVGQEQIRPRLLWLKPT